MIWFTADNHFGHAQVIDYCDRPFASVEAMGEAMVESWNAVVAPGDLVYHLGDVALGKRKETLQVVSRLNGTKLLIPGNHDAVWPRTKGRHPRAADYRLYEDVGFQIQPLQLTIEMAGREVLLSHLPYRGDSGVVERYCELRPVDRGIPILCGHVHNHWATQDHQFNVGVDVRSFAPVGADSVAAWLDTLTIGQETWYNRGVPKEGIRNDDTLRPRLVRRDCR